MSTTSHCLVLLLRGSEIDHLFGASSTATRFKWCYCALQATNSGAAMRPHRLHRVYRASREQAGEPDTQVEALAPYLREFSSFASSVATTKRSSSRPAHACNA